MIALSQPAPYAFEWMMGRGFYHEEANLRAALTSYFVDSKYSFRELVYAVATHPAFTEGTRSDATVTDPLEEPPFGSHQELSRVLAQRRSTIRSISRPTRVCARLVTRQRRRPGKI